jgi:hypothetical protein
VLKICSNDLSAFTVTMAGTHYQPTAIPCRAREVPAPAVRLMNVSSATPESIEIRAARSVRLKATMDNE